MSDRIKELARQAGLTAPYGSDREGLRDFDYREFANMIVRECCIALNPMLRDMISRGQGVDLIKLHFGMNPKEITTAMLDAAITQCEQELAKKKSGVEE